VEVSLALVVAVALLLQILLPVVPRLLAVVAVEGVEVSLALVVAEVVEVLFQILLLPAVPRLLAVAVAAEVEVEVDSLLYLPFLYYRLVKKMGGCKNHRHLDLAHL